MNLNKITLCLFSFIMCFSIDAQKEANMWYFGYNAGLDFNTNPPTIITNSNIISGEGCSSVSDEYGNLLFYTDGQTTWDASNDTMINGFNLFGSPSSSCAAIIVPKPGTYNVSLKRYDNYFIFTVDEVNGNNGVRYSEVEMNLNGGLGAVNTNKNILMFDTKTSEKITAIRHANNCDFWVIGKEYGSSFYRSHLITSAGVNLTPVLSNGPTLPDNTGFIKASPNQKMIATAYAHQGLLEVYNFDRSNGNLLRTFYDSLPIAFGVEFSPDNTKLYATALLDSNVYQYDLTATTIPMFRGSKISVGKCIGPYIYISGAIQLAPNGKIYVTNCISDNLSVINDPNNYGTSSNFVQMGQSIAPGNSSLSLPTLPPFFYNEPNYIKDSIHECPLFRSFTINDTNGITENKWTINNILNDVVLYQSNINENDITFKFNDTGTYNIRSIVSYYCYIDTLYDTVSINHLEPKSNFINSNNISTLNNQGTFSNLSTNAIQYKWFFNNNYIDNSDDLIYKFNDNEIYNEMCLEAISSKNCRDTSCLNVIIGNDYNIYIPNSFTPNNDNVNDVLLAKGVGVNAFNLIIFNRWGELIFESNDIEKGWDGKHKGLVSPTGLYTWKIKYQGHGSVNSQTLYGHVNLLR